MKRRFSAGASGRKRGRNRRNGSGSRGERLPWRLLLCGGIFVLLVLLKLLLPSGLGAWGTRAAQVVDWSVDVERVLSALGRAAAGGQNWPSALKDACAAAFSPEAAPQPQSFEGEQPLSGQLLSRLESGGSVLQLLAEAPEEMPAEPTAGSYVYTEENLPARVSMNQKILGIGYTTPARGQLSSGFGYRDHPIYGEEQFHYGIDIANDSGTEILCFADGTVQTVGESSLMGKYLIVSHPNSICSLYAHCSEICIRQGETVTQGALIARMGSTGLSTGPHLHFELQMNGLYLNPIYYVALEG